MLSKEVKVNCPIGLLVEPAGVVCKEAVAFKSHVNIEYEGGTANAKSMLSLLGAAIRDGDRITIICDGEDEEEALNVIADVFENRLG
ncbi:MAG: HPr family phosphocarrier protein [Eubacterium sp.]|nr:HPr family phosphocarrier protein [Eubacterium sp.]